MDGYLLAAAAVLIAGGYRLGRRGQVWVAVAVLCVVEAGAALALVRWQSAAYWLVEQVVVVVALFAVSAGAYRRLRHRLAMSGWEHARSAGLRERARIAAELHDTLGHDLALLSLQAAGIQVTAAEPAIRERAAAIRAGAAEATDTVRRLVDLLREEPDVLAVIARARAAGMTVEVTGEPPADDLSPRLIAEALSNAARHAPGEPVTVAFGEDNQLEVRNPAPDGAGGDDRAGTGLAALAERLVAAGGELTAGSVDGQFRLAARVPAGAGGDPLAADYRSQRRRARTVLVTTLLGPLGALILITTGFYAWAAHDTTIESGTYRRLSVGMSETAARPLLPPRQALVRLGGGHGPGCEHYTDGNYPLAYDTYEICFAGGVVSRLTDRSGKDR